MLKKLWVKWNEFVFVVGNGVIYDVIGCVCFMYYCNIFYIMLFISVVVGIDVGLFFCIGCDGFGFKNLFGVYYFFVLMLIDRSFFCF